MFFGITEISKMWVFFPYSLCTFFQALHVACSIDLCDSSLIDSSLAVQYPRLTHWYLTNRRLYLTQKCCHLLLHNDFCPNKTLEYETKPPVLNNQ